MDESRQFLNNLLTGSASIKASDLHLRVGAPPYVRVDGRLTKVKGSPMTGTQIEEIVQLTSGRSAGELERDSWEYSFDHPGVGRFRGHVFCESGNWALALRVMPPEVPSFQDLRLPPVVKVLSEPSPGLTLITGPTGSGKSTTTAAMLQFAVATQPLHVLTIEDPVEYHLADKGSCISQREIGRDVPSYAAALKSALREDPDILFVGEIRDAESLSVVIQAAETGHCVLSTFHTGSTLRTIQRLLAMLGGEDQISRGRLADTLRGVLSQRLLPRKGTRGRVLCCEVMVNNYAVKECIKDAVKLNTLPAVLERSGDQQMHTFDQNLVKLVVDGLVLPNVALTFAASPGDLKRNLRLQNVDA